jgi:hypothetical protein
MLTSILRKLSVGAFCCGVALGLLGCVSGSADTTFKTDNGSISIAFTDPVTGATVTNISMSNAAKVTATVRDPSGNLVPNTVVTFATSASLATMVPASGSALTDAFGVASIKLIGASPTAAGAATVSATASVGGFPLTVGAGFGVLATTSGATGISIALINMKTGAVTSSIDTNQPAKVSVTLRDTAGALVPNAVVTFVTAEALASMIPATGTALTDASGVAWIQINAARPTAAGAATITASASVGGASLSASAGFGVNPTDNGVTGTIRIDPLTSESTTVDSTSGAVTTVTKIVAEIKTGSLLYVNATVSDASGKGVPNTVVTFTTAASLITMYPASGSAVTDSSGRASIQIAVANPTAAGAATITASATVNGTLISGSINLNVIATKSAETVKVKLTIPGSPVEVTNISSGKPAQVTATVKDGSGAVVSKTVVTFATSAALASMTPSTGTALTNAAGEATILIDPSSPLAAGAAEITATATVDGGVVVVGRASFSVTASDVGVPGVRVVLTDLTPAANAVSSISPGSPAKVKATIRNAAGLGVANTVVTFSTTATLATMTPSTGTALTNASGEATIQIDAASLTAAGATTITATASVDGALVSGSTGFSVSAANASIASMSVGSNPLSPYATTSVSVAVAGVPKTTPVTINFSSICAGTGKATLPASVQTSNGTATATYTDKGCASLDTITASVAGLAVTKTITLDVKAPGAISIQFVSATPTTIALKGTGGAGLVESSLVRFRVVDSNNLPVSSGVNVTFDLTTRTGGILLDGASAAVTKLTDANGEASVTVQSGTTPTSVWVTASMTGTTLLSQSNQLRISTGRPAQDRFTLGVSKYNIEGFKLNGITTTVRAIASDRLGNPVPDGTAINFVAEGGQIQPSCLTGTPPQEPIGSGGCSVTFTTANPVPTNGRVTVVAYSLGEESFVDANGNNKYDSGETFTDLGDVFIDNNENGTWDADEQSISYAGNGQTCASAISSSPSAPSKAGTCDGKWGQAHVRQSDVIVLSGSTLSTITPASGASFSMGGADQCSNSTAFNFTVADSNNNPLPNGTTITTSQPDALSTVTISPSAVQNTNLKGGTTHTLGVSKLVTAAVIDANGNVTTLAHCVSLGTGANLTISFTTPSGVVSTANFKITD